MTAALACGDTLVTPAQADEQVGRIAAAMRRDGITEGSVVALAMRNEPRYVMAALAARRLGAYALPLNWHFKADEAGWILADSGASLLVAHADLLAQMRAGLPAGLRVLPVEAPPAVRADYGLGAAHGADPWDAWLAPDPDALPAAAPRMPMTYTSGTTGRPKGVVRGPMQPEHQALAAQANRATFGLRPGARVLVSTSMYHSAPSTYAQLAALGCELLVIEPRFDAARLLALIERHAITHLYLVPTLFVRLLRLPPEVRARHDLRSLEFVLHGAAPCPVSVKRAMIDWWGPVIHEFYGGSEAGPIAASDSPGWLEHPGSVGRAVPNVDLMVCDEAGQPLPAGATGRTYIRQRNYPDFSYHRDEARRAACAHPREPGYFTLGDVGRLEADGWLWITDRSTDMVISGGVNIYPAEIEDVLAALPGVADCAVFGVPDEEFGEALLAVVQPAPGATLDESQVREYLRARLAGYKVPRRVEFAAELPREESGKIFKRRLREARWREAGRSI